MMSDRQTDVYFRYDFGGHTCEQPVVFSNRYALIYVHSLENLGLPEQELSSTHRHFTYCKYICFYT